MAVTVEVKGGEKYKRFLDAVSRIAGSVRAGIPANATHKSEDGSTQSIAAYAIYNEFGTSRIPARPFMRQTAESNTKKWIASMVGYIKSRNPAEPQTWKNALGAVGELMAKDIIAEIEKGSFAPNAPATVAAKKRKGKTDPAHPLIDTGDMQHAVISEVLSK